MKFVHLAVVSALLFVVSACSKEKSAETLSAQPAVESATADATASAPATSAEAVPSTVVAGKVALKFPHSVRANLESTEGGVTSHTLRVEYRELDATAVAAAIAEAFEAEGYVVKSDGTKNVAMSDAGKVRYTIVPVGPDLKVELSAPESKGLVTFIW